MPALVLAQITCMVTRNAQSANRVNQACTEHIVILIVASSQRTVCRGSKPDTEARRFVYIRVGAANSVGLQARVQG